MATAEAVPANTRPSEVEEQTAAIPVQNEEPVAPNYAALARIMGRGPLSERTIKDQRACLGAGSVFLLGWFNLVEIKGLAEVGHNLVASTRVLTWIAFTLAVYYFLRFIGDALIDLHVAKIERAVSKDDFLNALTASSTATLDKELAPTFEIQNKLKAREAFGEDQVRRLGEVGQQFSPAIEEYTAKIRVLGDELNALPEEASDARKAVMEQIVGLGYHRGKLVTQLDELNRPILEAALPYPEIDAELKQLLDRAFDPERMQAARKRLDRVFDVYSLERRRHSVTRLLDIGVPSLLMLLVLVCAGTSLVRWLLGLSW